MPHVRSVLAAVAAAALLAACGDDAAVRPEAAPSTSSPATTPPASEADLKSALKDAATAMESHAIDAGSYTEDVGDLEDQGLAVEPGVTVTVVSADKKSYCIKAASAETAYYYDSDTGKPTRTPCR